MRGKGQPLGSSTHWVMNAIISAAFPVVAKSFYPETKNVSLDEMQNLSGIEAKPTQQARSAPEISESQDMRG
jgi:hypothetical protein